MVMPEFFYYTQSILKYAITTQDSIELSLKDLGDDYLMELTIHMPVQVEFLVKLVICRRIRMYMIRRLSTKSGSPKR